MGEHTTRPKMVNLLSNLCSDSPVEHTDHLMGMSHTPSGTVVVRRLFDGPIATDLEVVRAEPRTCFTDALLNAIRHGDSIYPNVRVEGFDEWGPHICNQATCSPERTCFTGIRLHIDGKNQHVVYLIGRYIPENGTWEAVWPD